MSIFVLVSWCVYTGWKPAYFKDSRTPLLTITEDQDVQNKHQ